MDENKSENAYTDMQPNKRRKANKRPATAQKSMHSTQHLNDLGLSGYMYQTQ